ncbi:hypothetical protein DFH05DRAFT_1240466 [Lentinula detonsa]|uniref:Uncharacterized protein n=1 Tax=Lentinula detonsa TaxID=2804962 RepID=A0A9W8NZF5_9AGAR|nr:hypothetical protein DFH05DRAFT_1240466 [Lentinula detonsa]
MLRSLILELKHHGSRALSIIYPMSVLMNGSAVAQRGYRKVNDAGEFRFNSAPQAPPAVQKLLKKFEALGSNPPHDASLYSRETIQNHVSADIRKYTQRDERDITLKDLRIARRLDFHTYVRTKLNELDPSTTRQHRKRMTLKFISHAVARWHSLTLKEKLVSCYLPEDNLKLSTPTKDIASSVRQRRMDPNSSSIGPSRRSVIQRRQIKQIKAKKSIDHQIRLLRVNQAWRKHMRKRYIHRKRREQQHSHSLLS